MLVTVAALVFHCDSDWIVPYLEHMADVSFRIFFTTMPFLDFGSCDTPSKQEPTVTIPV